MSALFACTKCHKRLPFEELSSAKQLCSICRIDAIKCYHCKVEFNQENKGSGDAICKSCSYSIKTYGKPIPCQYCTELSAFSGKKCQRCSHQEKKYGAPQICNRCKKMCAFDRGEEYRKNMNGELLCWLCIASFKKQRNKRPREDPPSISPPSHDNKNDFSEIFNDQKILSETSPKKRKNDTVILKKMISGDYSEHVASVAQLKDSINQLKRQITSKDQLLLQKDQKITELKAQHFESEKHMRTKLQTMQTQHEDSIEILQGKVRELQKKVALNTKSSKKS